MLSMRAFTTMHMHTCRQELDVCTVPGDYKVHFHNGLNMLLKDNSTMNEGPSSIIGYSLLNPTFAPMPTFIQEEYCCLNSSLQTRNRGSGSGHFSLLIAYLDTYDISSKVTTNVKCVQAEEISN